MTDPLPSSDDLMTRVAAGDREAFAALYRRHRPDVYRFAVHMSGSSAAAEDVVQDVFLAVIEHAARYQRGRSGVLPWLLGMARNHVRRSRQARATQPLPDDDTADLRALTVRPDPVADLSHRRRTDALTRALADVPFVYREAIVLCDLQELSYETAAGILGCAIGTVRSRLNRGHSRLARLMCGRETEFPCGVPAPKTS